MRALNPREKLLLKVLGAVAVFGVVYFFVIMPLFSLWQSADQVQNSNQARISRIERIYNEYNVIKVKRTRYETLLNNKNDNLTTLIQQVASSNGIAGNIAYTRRTQTNVQNKYVKITTDVKIDGVPIQNLLKFMHDIENSNNLVFISSVRINQGIRDTKKYDALIKIVNFVSQ